MLGKKKHHDAIALWMYATPLSVNKNEDGFERRPYL